MLAAGALPQIAKAPLSALYHAPGAAPQDQATIVLIWQATQGMLDALLVTGLLLVTSGLIGFGVAMLKAPAFGRGYGGLTVALGAIAFAAATVLVTDVSRDRCRRHVLTHPVPSHRGTEDVQSGEDPDGV